jgi:hypothetical protein
MILNISTLVVGEKYRNYCDFLLYSLNRQNTGKIKVCITHDGEYLIRDLEYPNLQIIKNVLNSSYKEHMSSQSHFPYFLKNEAIKFAINNHSDDDVLLHLDCDSVFHGDPYQFIVEILNTYKLKNNLYVFKNNRFKTRSNVIPNKKESILYCNEYDCNLGEFIIHQNPKCCIWFMEGFILFNLDKDNILKFSKKWDDAIEIIHKNSLSFRPDRDEIVYSCLNNNIDMGIVEIKVKDKYFGFLYKHKFDRIWEDSKEFSKIFKLYYNLNS